VTLIPVESTATTTSEDKRVGSTDRERSRSLIRRKRWCSPQTGVRDEQRELSRESFHLPVGHLEKEEDAGHPLDEKIRVLVGMTPFSSVHSMQVIRPVVDELQGEIELSPPDQAFIHIRSRRDDLYADVPTALSLA
jgi:hypothetical protein